MCVLDFYRLVFKFHYPERGRKHSNLALHQECYEFKFHYPERGQKPNFDLAYANVVTMFKFHYPERGRKRKC